MAAQAEDRTDCEGWGAGLATRADVEGLRVLIAKSGARTARRMVASVSVGAAVMAVVYRVVG